MADAGLGLSRQTTNSRVEEALRAMVMDGRLEPGERINEAELAEQFGISRGPLREAVQRLASVGILEHIPHKGARVPLLDVAQLHQLYEVRYALESFAARLAAERASEEDISRLHTEFAGIGEELVARPAGPYPVQRDLHFRIALLSGNTELTASIERLIERINPYRWRSSYRAGRGADAHAEHSEVIVAIAGRDPDAAELAMRKHLATALVETSIAVEGSPDGPQPLNRRG